MDLKEYDNIKVPERLNEYIDKGIEKGINYKKRNGSNTFIKVASILLISTVTLLSVSNIPAVAKELIKIPVIGQIVKVLDLTKNNEFGGIITDGNSLIVDSLNENSINIYFSKDGALVENAPHYEIEYREYPYTIVLTFDGVRGLYGTYIEEKVKQLPQVKDVYSIMALDDSRRKIAIEFKENIDFKVTELKEPAMIQIELNDKKEIEGKTAYFIRTQEFDYGEEIAMVEESLMYYENVQVQKVKNEKYIIQFGPYENKEEAELMIKSIESDENITVKFYLESREIGHGAEVDK